MRASKTAPDARLYRKDNTASELRYIRHTLSNNRHGLIANAQITLGAGKGHDVAEFVEAPQELEWTQ